MGAVPTRRLTENEVFRGDPATGTQPRLRPAVLQPRRIAIKSNGRILFLDADTIVAVEAEGNYVLLVCEAASHLMRETMASAAAELEPYGFVRIHRSILVNAAHVKEIQPCATGEYALRLYNGKEYAVTRTYKKNLRLLAGYWIGADNFL